MALKKKLKALMKKKGTTEQVNIMDKIDKEVYKMLKLQTILEGTDEVEIIEKAIRNYVSEQKKKIVG